MCKQQRLREGKLFIAGLHDDRIVAPFVLEGAINRDAFKTYFAGVLVPDLRPGDPVVTDNLSNYKGPRVQELIERAGASVRYLPPYSPDFDPNEKALTKLKALLRKAAVYHCDLWDSIGAVFNAFTPNGCANYFAAGGCDAS